MRNFTFLPAADRELVRLKVVTGKNMTAVLEDLILGRRQFGEQIERFLDGEMARTGKSRHEIIELAVLLFLQAAPPQRAGRRSADLSLSRERPQGSSLPNGRSSPGQRGI